MSPKHITCKKWLYFFLVSDVSGDNLEYIDLICTWFAIICSVVPCGTCLWASAVFFAASGSDTWTLHSGLVMYQKSPFCDVNLEVLPSKPFLKP